MADNPRRPRKPDTEREHPMLPSPMRPSEDTEKPGEPVDEDSVLLSSEPIELPINGTLDLHTFLPRDLKTLLPDYLQECQQRGLLDVRVVHGKGTGALRRSVHAILDRSPMVDSYQQAGEGGGGWGATLVRLHPTHGQRAG